MMPARSLASGVTLPSTAITFATLTTSWPPGPEDGRDLREDRAELVQVGPVVAVAARVAGQRILRVVDARHVRRRRQDEIRRLIHEAGQVAGISPDHGRGARPASRDLEMLRHELDADGPASQPFRDRQCRPVSRERIQHEFPGPAGMADDGGGQRLREVDVVRGATGPLGDQVRGAKDERLASP